jgi:predicted RNA-binding Zn-ribbon protein involved in translation (DUF1610 family)/gas vesicle protein
MEKGKENADTRAKEADAYARLRADVQHRLAEIRDRINPEAVRHAVSSATERLKDAGGHTVEAVNKAADALRKDIAHAAHTMGPAWEKFSEKSSDVFHVWRDRGGVFLAGAADAVRDWLKETTTRIENQRYETGEMAYTGAFECTACGERVALKQPAHLPPCPKCMKTEFRRLS